MPFGINARGDKARILERIQEQALAHEGCDSVQKLTNCLAGIVDEIPADAAITLSFSVILNYSTEERVLAGPREVGI